MIADHGSVIKQYSRTDGLQTRIALHARYSRNKQGFPSWIYSNYNFTPGMRVLELGCGDGSMWRGRLDIARPLSELVLTDISQAMLDSARAAVAPLGNVRLLTADASALQFETASFDAVIGNMMLHHVPDIRQALNEIRRVLKPGGCFYCAAPGRAGYSGDDNAAELLPPGLQEISDQLLSACGAAPLHSELAFNLNNGAVWLRAVFDSVRLFNYDDALDITDPNDLVDYIFTLTDFSDRSIERETLLREIENLRDSNGVIHIPKYYGMFVAC